MPIDLNQLLPILLGQKMQERRLAQNKELQEKQLALQADQASSIKDFRDAQLTEQQRQLGIQDRVGEIADTLVGGGLPIAPRAPGEAGAALPPTATPHHEEVMRMFARGDITPQQTSYLTGGMTIDDIQRSVDIATGVAPNAAQKGQLDLEQNKFDSQREQAVTSSLAQVLNDNPLTNFNFTPDEISTMDFATLRKKLATAPKEGNINHAKLQLGVAANYLEGLGINQRHIAAMAADATDRLKAMQDFGIGLGDLRVRGREAGANELRAVSDAERVGIENFQAMLEQGRVAAATLTSVNGSVEATLKYLVDLSEVAPNAAEPLVNGAMQAVQTLVDLNREGILGQEHLSLTEGRYQNTFGLHTGMTTDIDPKVFNTVEPQDYISQAMAAADGTIPIEQLLNQEISVPTTSGGIQPGGLASLLFQGARQPAPQGGARQGGAGSTQGGGSNGNVQPPLPLTNEQLGESPLTPAEQKLSPAPSPSTGAFSSFNDTQKMSMAEQAGVPNVLQTYNSLVLKSGIKTASAWLDTILLDIAKQAFLDTAPPLGTSESPRSPSPKPSTVRSGGTPSTVRSRR